MKKTTLFAAIVVCAGCGGGGSHTYNASVFSSCLSNAGGVPFAFTDGSRIAPAVNWGRLERNMPGGTAVSFPSRDEYVLFYVSKSPHDAQVLAGWVEQQFTVSASHEGDLVVVTSPEHTRELDEIIGTCRSSAATT